MALIIASGGPRPGRDAAERSEGGRSGAASRESRPCGSSNRARQPASPGRDWRADHPTRRRFGPTRAATSHLVSRPYVTAFLETPLCAGSQPRDFVETVRMDSRREKGSRKGDRSPGKRKPGSGQIFAKQSLDPVVDRRSGLPDRNRRENLGPEAATASALPGRWLWDWRPAAPRSDKRLSVWRQDAATSLAVD